jgi:predicted CopG family antitoxin
MARIATEKYANRRVRSFNLDDANYRGLKRLSAVEDMSMSDIINRILTRALAKRKVDADIENGLQTTLEIHVQSEEIRAKRKDGKCNPKVVGLPPCSMCWGVNDV